MKGIILAGGQGTRLKPLTNVTNKHLLPVYNKPMILYPLKTLKSLAIDDILIVTGGKYIGRFAEYLGDGTDYGVSLTYKVQEEAKGIAHAIGLAEEFIGDDDFVAILGDNVFDNDSLPTKWKDGATLFTKEVSDPERFGVAEIENGQIISIEEKPDNPKSNHIITGLYKYTPEAFDVIRTLEPSDRGELEITDLNMHYVNEGKCHAVDLGKTFWSDAGTHIH